MPSTCLSLHPEQVVKAEKAASQPPRLSKIRFEDMPVQVDFAVPQAGSAGGGGVVASRARAC